MGTQRRPTATVPTAARTAAALLAVALLATGCAPDDGPTTAGTSGATATTSAAPSSTPSTTPTATDAPVEPEDAGAAAPFGTTADADPSTDALLSVTGLRTGSHDGYDRVVIDLGGTGTPGWHAEVGASAAVDPSDEVVDLGGAGVLTLVLTGIGYPFDTGQTELAPGTEVPGSGAITAAAFSGTFEGQAQVFVGLTDVDPSFRAFLLHDPTRLVVDIQH
jgi:hypothetical protein